MKSVTIVLLTRMMRFDETNQSLNHSFGQLAEVYHSLMAGQLWLATFPAVLNLSQVIAHNAECSWVDHFYIVAMDSVCMWSPKVRLRTAH